MFGTEAAARPGRVKLPPARTIEASLKLYATTPACCSWRPHRANNLICPVTTFRPRWLLHPRSSPVIRSAAVRCCRTTRLQIYFGCNAVPAGCGGSGGVAPVVTSVHQSADVSNPVVLYGLPLTRSG